MGQFWSKEREIIKEETIQDTRQAEAIRKLVNDMLKDKNINNTLIPDIIEEKIYKSIITVVMSQIKLTLESTKIEFMNHEIHFTVKPIVIANE